MSRGRRNQPIQTPRKLTEKTQTASVAQGRFSPVRTASAGIGATKPLDVMAAAADAVVWLMLLSSMSQAGSSKRRDSGTQNANASSRAVIDMLKDQPIFSPEYTLQGARTRPENEARD